jgi:hypothetical protein
MIFCAGRTLSRYVPAMAATSGPPSMSLHVAERDTTAHENALGCVCCLALMAPERPPMSLIQDTVRPPRG